MLFQGLRPGHEYVLTRGLPVDNGAQDGVIGRASMPGWAD